MDSEKITIGLTIGVFDCLHEGHIYLLQEAKKQCDYLIVGITTDYLTMIQKGYDRPKQPYQLRYNILAKTKLCDKIIEIDNLDMTNYLKIADIWIKGEDQIKMVPNNFHNIYIVEHKLKISTTKIIKEKKDANKRKDT